MPATLSRTQVRDNFAGEFDFSNRFGKLFLGEVKRSRGCSVIFSLLIGLQDILEIRALCLEALRNMDPKSGWNFQACLELFSVARFFFSCLYHMGIYDVSIFRPGQYRIRLLRACDLSKYQIMWSQYRIKFWF